MARYRISYGVFGQVGEITIARTFSADGAQTVMLVGQGQGSILGMGQTVRRIESEYDPRIMSARRWTSFRSQSGKPLTDTVEQATPGAVQVVRRRPGRPDELGHLNRGSAVLDPLAFLMRVRTAPPNVPSVFEMLDGRGLWRVTAQPPKREAGRTPTLRIEGKANPIFWDGQPDTERTARNFTLFLSDDASRLPLRLVLPVGITEVRAELESVHRSTTASRVAGS